MEQVRADRLDEEMEELLGAAGGSERVLERAIGRRGPDRVAAEAVAEIAFRCAPPSGCRGDVRVGVTLTHGPAAYGHLFRLSDGAPVKVSEGVPENVEMRLEARLTDVVRELYGPASGRSLGVFRAELLPALRRDAGAAAGSPDAGWEGCRRIAAATNVIVNAVSDRAPALDRLALRHPTDKWGGIHWFTPHYERHLGPLRDQVVRVLEIGIGGYDDLGESGGSLKMWKHFFGRGLIYGVDLFDKSQCDEPRVRTLRGDQNDPDFLRRLGEELGPFDVVIDDGSHINEHMRTSFRELYPYLRNGGYYVIEDLWTSYCPGYGGDETPGRRDEATAVGLVKELVDAVQHEEIPEPGARLRETGRSLLGVHMYHNIAFLEKGVNEQGGVPPWVGRAPFWGEAPD
ncbi:class I SAM-dependent methyltransferase [Actinomadura viridis]|uniref:Methyltransferase MycE N-terminal domain-containing protein n=1 Tax=Actinomadura viridis TaxID=58110 RepID=A0A931GG30_9ACTN|nr:hypothetical protein [Actinomadura viridis]MBG6085953.1 hypothetical protein [Actinomadura viridis]